MLLLSGDHNPYDSHEEDRYRRPIRAKPIMIPVDQPPPPRERKLGSCLLFTNTRCMLLSPVCSSCSTYQYRYVWLIELVLPVVVINLICCFEYLFLDISFLLVFS